MREDDGQGAGSAPPDWPSAWSGGRRRQSRPEDRDREYRPVTGWIASIHRLIRSHGTAASHGRASGGPRRYSGGEPGGAAAVRQDHPGQGVAPPGGARHGTSALPIPRCRRPPGRIPSPSGAASREGTPRPAERGFPSGRVIRRVPGALLPRNRSSRERRRSPPFPGCRGFVDPS